MSLSDRIRPDVEAAPWVIAEVKKLEAESVELKNSNARMSEYANSVLEAAITIRTQEEKIALIKDTLVKVREELSKTLETKYDWERYGL
jgi:hypothetical protein